MTAPHTFRALRRDGSFCWRRVAQNGICPFHGAWMPRDKSTGLPSVTPPEGSVWAYVIAQAVAGPDDREEEMTSMAVTSTTATVAVEEERMAAANEAARVEAVDATKDQRVRGGKAPLSGRQRLAAKIARGERRAVAAADARIAAASETQHRMRQMW